MKQFTKFFLASGVAAIVNIVSRYLFNLVVSYQAAIVAAFLIAMTTAYILNRMFVFKASDSVGNEFIRFVIVNMIALVLVLVTSLTLADIIFPAIDFSWYAKDVAHIIGVAVPALTSFIGHKHFTFQKAS